MGITDTVDACKSMHRSNETVQVCILQKKNFLQSLKCYQLYLYMGKAERERSAGFFGLKNQ